MNKIKKKNLDNQQYIEFKERIKNLGLKINYVNWLIGFSEGDGSFVLGNDPKRPPHFEITQNLRDIDLLYEIRTTIGYGSIIKREEAHRRVAVYQLVGNKEGLKKIIKIFNGGIRLPHKLERLKLFVEAYNGFYHDENIEVINTLCPITLQDSWLTGFTDSDGSLQVRIKKCKTSKIGYSVPSRIAWSQKNQESLELIKSSLGLKVNISYDKSWDGYRLQNENMGKNKILITYLNSFPFKTKKILEYRYWCKIIEIKTQGLTNERLQLIEDLIKSFRQKRL